MKATLLVIAAFLATVAGAFAAAVVYGDYLFALENETQIENLLNRTRQSPADPVESAVFSGLPRPVRRYFGYALVKRRTYIRSAHVTFSGLFRTAPEQPWLPIQGQEVFCTKPPGFVWTASMKIAPGVWIEMRDRYMDRRGHILAKFYSVIPMTDMQGKMLDPSNLFRFFSEAPWFPTALLPGLHIQWEAIDDRSARAFFSDGSLRASAAFFFDDEGKITRITTKDKYREVNGRPRPAAWTGSYGKYREINGVRVPTEVAAAWHPDPEAFHYSKLFLMALHYDREG